MPPDPHEYPGLEQLANQLYDELRTRKLLPPDVGCAIWLFHYGQRGGLAYIATSGREDMIRTVIEWLARQVQEGHREVILAALKEHMP